MKTLAIHEFGGRDKIHPTDLPRPTAGRGEILIRVVAAAVNPVDWKIREGRLASAFPHRFPIVLGWDVAGVIEDLGEGTSWGRKGDRVFAYARKPEIQWGTYAEYVTVPEKHAAPMPARLLFEEAAAVPLAALTAHQALVGRAGIREGSTVLVHAAAGGVGHFAVQIARHAGARVFGTAGPANQEFVLSQGAQHAIDYTREDFRDALRRIVPEGVDVVFDAVGGTTLARSFDVVKEGGCVIGIVDRPDPAEASRRRVRAEYVFVEPDGDRLRLLAAVIEKRRLQPHVHKILPFSSVAAAHEASEGGHVRGKLVLAW